MAAISAEHEFGALLSRIARDGARLGFDGFLRIAVYFEAVFSRRNLRLRWSKKRGKLLRRTV